MGHNEATGITAEEFAGICDDVWVATGLPAAEQVAGAELGGEPAALVGRTHTGQVQITGAWAGAVTIQLSAALATTVASEMFGLEEDELEESDVTDAVGELANMIAGNVKARLPQPSQLSLPSVTVGQGYEVSVLGSKVTASLERRCGDEAAVLRMLEGATT